MKSDIVKEQATGRWPGIFSALGIEVGDGRHTSCPMCGGRDRFRFDDKSGSGSWICNHCGAGDGWSLLMKKLGLTFPDAIKEVGGIVCTVPVSTTPKESKMSPELMRSLFVGSKPVVEADPVHRYLQSRGLSKISSALRYHPKCWESETKRNQRAMLAVFTGADGVAVTMHRTYLDADGMKLPIESPKKILPPLKKMTGGAVRLFYPAGDILGLAEGIETAIAASEDTNIPVWAALSATLMESFEVPKSITKLVIFSDNDRNYSGQKAAYSLAFKAAMKGIQVSIYIPEIPGEDWADVHLKNSKQNLLQCGQHGVCLGNAPRKHNY